ncbi:hypothetical protein LTR15_000105 [Elasticomyces elasticus]|nr:hypothetical protein LTR15_000105 [Elasticomyces elasticus]
MSLGCTQLIFGSAFGSLPATGGFVLTLRDTNTPQVNRAAAPASSRKREAAPKMVQSPSPTRSFPNPQTVQLHYPPDSTFPPYESKIDVRIPSHFADEDRDMDWYTKDGPLKDIMSQARGGVNTLLNAGHIIGTVHLATARYIDPVAGKMMRDGPLFFAITATEETLHHWRNVHWPIRKYLIEKFKECDEPVFKDPPIRWLLENKSWP